MEQISMTRKKLDAFAKEFDLNRKEARSLANELIENDIDPLIRKDWTINTEFTFQNKMYFFGDWEPSQGYSELLPVYMRVAWETLTDFYNGQKDREVNEDSLFLEMWSESRLVALNFLTNLITNHPSIDDIELLPDRLKTLIINNIYTYVEKEQTCGITEFEDMFGPKNPLNFDLDNGKIDLYDRRN